MIGPFRGGRVLAVTGVLGDPNTFYFGAVGGGVWKTANAGVTWVSIFDSQRIASIGDIAVAPSDRRVIYVGTGEADMRSDISFGDGIYKSVDGGRTWTHAGLRESRQIGRVLVHPKNPDAVYVAALGHAYGPSAERGVFRSMDGCRTWRKVLDGGPDIGAADLAFDPENPQVIYATTWNARRTPWSQYPPVVGAGSGLYKSTDAGDHWTQLTGNGLPGGDWGRVGIAVARAGRRIYALIDAESGGLYRSDDSGATWALASNDLRIRTRSWYFSGITVDPNNPDIVYVPNVALYRSTDGGRNFTVLRGAPGGDDYHTVWIDSSNSSRMIVGTDQGASISVDGGSTWSTWYNQPTAQFYHVITDNQFPYFVYGSQQDSGSAAVASRTNHGQITERDWFSVGGGESGYIAIDPKDPNIVYAGNTNGRLIRFDKRTAQGQTITPWPELDERGDISEHKYRFPWTAPLVFSPLEPNTLYYGAQYLLKTTDGGLNWQQMSPDLTGDTRKDRTPAGPPAVENAKSRGFGVIYSIAPSPLKAQVIWTGSDTGMIHVTRDGGKTWADGTPKGLSDWSKITHIEASHYDPAAAYAAVDRHRLEDYKPHVYRTRDYGKTWTEIVNGLEEPAFINAVREDPVRKGLLFAAAELGVYVSFDDGDHWQSLQLNLPATSVRDLAIHGDDLVIATHGRSFWILDDIAPLRQIDARVAAMEVSLLKPAPAIRLSSLGFQGTPLPPEFPQAKNPPDGAIIDFYLQSQPQGEVKLEILDAAQHVVRSYSTNDPQPSGRSLRAVADIWLAPPPRLAAKAGMNRFVWDLRYASPGAESDRDTLRPRPGPQVLPGTYQVRLTAGGRSYTKPVKVTLDPRSAATPNDLSKQLDLGLKTSAQLRRIGEAIARAQAQTSTDSARLVQSLRTAQRSFLLALNMVESADRTPPQRAYGMFEQASKDLDSLIGR
jgi:photosystem II stability/assembly factor-like uncharacterized protein